jgi:hypothetical protein
MLLICLLCVMLVDVDHQTIAFQRYIHDPKQSQRVRICLGLSLLRIGREANSSVRVRLVLTLTPRIGLASDLALGIILLNFDTFLIFS